MVRLTSSASSILRRRTHGFCAPATTTYESSKRNSKSSRSSARGPNLPCDQEIDVTLTQFTVQCLHLFGHEMKHDARIAPGKPIDDGGNKARCQEGIAPNSHFPSRRVGEKLDVLHRLAQVIEHGHSTIEQRATVRGRLYALWAAVEQAHADALSKSAIDLEMAGWVVFRSAAALFMLPACTTAIRTWRSCSFIRRPMRSLNCIAAPIAELL